MVDKDPEEWRSLHDNTSAVKKLRSFSFPTSLSGATNTNIDAEVVFSFLPFFSFSFIFHFVFFALVYAMRWCGVIEYVPCRPREAKWGISVWN
jgi:hypothetical protein